MAKLTLFQRDLLARLACQTGPVPKQKVLNGRPNPLPALYRLGLVREIFTAYSGTLYSITDAGRAALAKEDGQ